LILIRFFSVKIHISYDEFMQDKGGKHMFFANPCKDLKFLKQVDMQS